MANPHKGEITFKAGDAEYTMVFTTNAICELEDMLDKGLNTIVENMQRLSTVRALLWAGLRAKHGNVSLADAGGIIDVAGMAAVTDAVGRALNAAFPKPDAKAGPENPQ